MSRVKRSLNLKDFYYCYKDYCKRKGITPKSYSEYKVAMQTMGDVMSDILLKDGIISLPRMIGDIFFKKGDQKEVVPNGKNFEFNEHTDGYAYSLFWLSPERLHKKRNMWCFSGFRGTKRRSAKLFKSGQVQYPDFKMMNPRVMST